MALIKCPECGKQVSNHAKTCPECGCPVDVILKSSNNTSFKYKGQIYDFTKVEEIISSKEDWVVDVMVVLLNEYSFNKNDTAEICNIIRKNGNKIPEDIQKDKVFRKQECYSETQEEFDRKYSKPRCPTCRSTNVQRIGGGERVVSVATLGIFSKKLNKTFKCKNCKHTW